jgi:hypothetical protein
MKLRRKQHTFWRDGVAQFGNPDGGSVRPVSGDKYTVYKYVA